MLGGTVQVADATASPVCLFVSSKLLLALDDPVVVDDVLAHPAGIVVVVAPPATLGREGRLVPTINDPAALTVAINTAITRKRLRDWFERVGSRDVRTRASPLRPMSCSCQYREPSAFRVVRRPLTTSIHSSRRLGAATWRAAPHCVTLRRASDPLQSYGFPRHEWQRPSLDHSVGGGRPSQLYADTVRVHSSRKDLMKGSTSPTSLRRLTFFKVAKRAQLDTPESSPW